MLICSINLKILRHIRFKNQKLELKSQTGYQLLLYTLKHLQFALCIDIRGQ